MNLKLVKPDLPYFEQFNEMMREWNDSNTQIAPWFLNEPFAVLKNLLILFRCLIIVKMRI